MISIKNKNETFVLPKLLDKIQDMHNFETKLNRYTKL